MELILDGADIEQQMLQQAKKLVAVVCPTTESVQSKLRAGEMTTLVAPLWSPDQEIAAT